MAHRFRTRSSPAVVRAPRRKSAWFQFQPVITTMTATGGTIIFSLNAAALALRPFTVVRTRFELFLRSDQGGVSEDQSAGFGIAVVSDEAVAVGVTAVPTPISEMSSDLWFVHQVLFSSLLVVTAVAATLRGAAYTVDSMAMRKVGIGQDIVVVSELGTFGGGVAVSAGGRMLVKLS